jgi:hypothetical protein
MRRLRFLTLIFFVSGCETTERVSFESVLSNKFYSEKNIDAEYLDDIKIQDMLFTVDFNEIDQANTVIWLSARTNRQIMEFTFISVSLQGPKGEIVLKAGDMKPDCSNQLGSQSFECRLKLTEQTKRITSISGSDGFQLVVETAINEKSEKIVLQIQKVVQKYNVYPT